MVGTTGLVADAIDANRLEAEGFESTRDHRAQGGVVESGDLIAADFDAGVRANVPHAHLAKPVCMEHRFGLFNLLQLLFGHR